MDIEQALRQIADEGTPLSYGGLASLSELDRAQVERVAQVWPGVGTERRRKVATRLVEMAESSPDLDFVDIFLALLIKDPDEEVREKAIGGLWEFEDWTVAPRLVELLRSDPSPRVRAAAALGLGKCALAALENKMPERERLRIRDALMETLENKGEPWEVRRRALEGVAAFNSPRVQEYIRLTYASGDPTLRASALFAMGRSGDTSWTQTLFKETRSRDPALRYEAVTALGVLGEGDAVPYVAAAVQDDDLQVAVAAVVALREIGGGEARRALQRALESDEAAVQDAAHDALEVLDALDDPLAFKADES
ncbi:MAG: HEAT repeat domain-containing protein [Chloroflexi bacterium]|nr:HEAT repeat domain-containing protein [Chloroflexota bacterium]